MNIDAATAIAREILLEDDAIGAVEFHGDSMLPVLRDGDRLAVDSIEWERIAPGDIVIYRFDDRFPALRVVEKLADKLFLKADNWPAPIFEVWPEDILGLVVGLRRNGVEISSASTVWRRAAARAVLAYRVRKHAGTVRRRAVRLAQRLRADVRALGSGLIGMPSALQINVSSVCNLKCRMCPYLGVHRDDSYLTFMSEETFERLLPAVKLVGAVLFSGSGEPLYNRNLPRFIERVRRESPSTQISLTTNGTLLRQDVAEELVRLQLDTLTISIDGSTAATVESIRRNSDFERIIANVTQLAAIKRARGSRYPVLQANYMMGYGTYRELPQFIRLARRIGIEQVHLLEIQPSCREDVRDNLAAGIAGDEGRSLRYAIQIGHRLGIAIHLPSVSPNACLFPYHPHIGENGDVYPCCFLDYEGRTLFDGTEEVTLQPLAFGNATAPDFRASWNSREYRRFRRRNKKGDFPGPCRSCFDIRATAASRVAQVVGPRPQQPGR